MQRGRRKVHTRYVGGYHKAGASVRKEIPQKCDVNRRYNAATSVESSVGRDGDTVGRHITTVAAARASPSRCCSHRPACRVECSRNSSEMLCDEEGEARQSWTVDAHTLQTRMKLPWRCDSCGQSGATGNQPLEFWTLKPAVPSTLPNTTTVLSCRQA